MFYGTTALQPVNATIPGPGPIALSGVRAWTSTVTTGLVSGTTLTKKPDANATWVSLESTVTSHRDAILTPAITESVNLMAKK